MTSRRRRRTSDSCARSLRRFASRPARTFARYKRSTILRRIQRRMQIHQLEDLAGLCALLAGQPGGNRRPLPEFADYGDKFLSRSRSLYAVGARGDPALIHRQRRRPPRARLGGGLCHRRRGVLDCHPAAWNTRVCSTNPCRSKFLPPI